MNDEDCSFGKQARFCLFCLFKIGGIRDGPIGLLATANSNYFRHLFVLLIFGPGRCSGLVVCFRT